MYQDRIANTPLNGHTYALRQYDSPGKYEGGLMLTPYVHELSSDSPDDAIGDVSINGAHYTLVEELLPLPEDIRAHGLTAEEVAFLATAQGAIVTVDAEGFVRVAFYGTKGHLLSDWSYIEARVTRELASCECGRVTPTAAPAVQPLAELVTRIPEPLPEPPAPTPGDYNAEAQQNPPQHVLMPDGDLRFYATRGDPNGGWSMGDLSADQLALVRARKCPFVEAWVGHCGGVPEEHSLFCTRHNVEWTTRCFACGARSTKNCGHTSQFVCGTPECPNHSHTHAY